MRSAAALILLCACGGETSEVTEDRCASRASIDLSPGQPGALAAVPGGLWVADDAGGLLVLVDPESGQRVRTCPSPVVATSGLAALGAILLVGDAAGTDLLEVDTASCDFGVRCTLESGLSHLLWARGRLHAARSSGGEVLLLDPETCAPRGALPISAEFGLAHDGKHLIVARADRTLRAVNPDSGDVLWTWSSPVPAPGGIAFDGAVVWIADPTAGTLISSCPSR